MFKEAKVITCPNAIDCAFVCSTTPLVCTASGKNLHLTNFESEGLVGQLEGHASSVVGGAFSPLDHRVLHSCSRQGTVLTWDLRTASSVSQHDTFAALSTVEHTCLALNCAGRVLCSGTAPPADGDPVYQVFWDVRHPGQPLGVYNECHSDEITSLAFHPQRPQALLSSALDGLVCLFDLNQSGEEEALDTVFNSERLARCCGWLPTADLVYCLTTEETCLLWKARSSSLLPVPPPAQPSGSTLLALLELANGEATLISVNEDETILCMSTNQQAVLDTIALSNAENIRTVSPLGVGAASGLLVVARRTLHLCTRNIPMEE